MTPTAAAPAASGKVQRNYARILGQFADLCKMAERSEDDLRGKAESVSAWDVGQHLDHLAEADRFILGGIEAALEDPPPNVDKRPVFIGRVVLLTGFIPRGKGKAPEQTQPKASSGEEIRENLDARFAEAAVRFTQAKEANPADVPFQLYLKRAAHYMANGVPDGWIGVDSSPGAAGPVK